MCILLVGTVRGEYARYRGYKVVEVFHDTLTGGVADRPAMTALLSCLRRHKSKGRVVIIDDLNRFARDIRGYWDLRDLLKAAGGKLERARPFFDIETLQQKKRMLTGICPEAVELLKDRHVALGTFCIFKKMVPFRQIEAAELMVAMNKYTINYGRSLLAATPQDQLVDTGKPKAIKGLTDEQMSLMERESGNLEREFKMAEQSYGTDHLDLVLAKGYLSNLLGNPRVVRYLVQNHREILVEFQKITELETAAA